MKITLATLVGIILHLNAFLQCDSLHFVELGYVPAHCRTNVNQNGHGIVYAFAASPNGPCEYTWMNLQTGQISHNTTWGGLNIGEYKITATDSIGCDISEVVKLDSVNPQANFTLLTSTVYETDNGYTQAELVFTNTSTNIGDNLPDPWPDYLYAWNFDNTTWNSASIQDEFSVIIESPGYHEICLAGTNTNGCVDTLCQSFLITENIDSTLDVTFNYSSYTGEISVELLTDLPAQISFYSLDGILVLQSVLTAGSNTFLLSSGTYVYEVVNVSSGVQLLSGSFTVL
ncbi:MAG: hypothetical protein IPM74_14275 [Crocinitomicaceae bacterium]|nr:hypothetical protein [Crocinitomicaceae bacterium]MBK8927035.1 hypothetical protein [Crocinitomicaceae bacterium]